MTPVETPPVATQVAAVTAAVREAIVAAAAVKPRRGRPPGSTTRSARAAPPVIDAQARTTAAVVLEVLAGMRSTSDAAATLGVSPVRYYAIEARAIGGLIAACAPQSPGPGQGCEAKALARVTAERTRLEHETARLRAVLRSTRRHLGVKEPVVTTKPAAAGKKPRKSRRPTVRALTVVRRLLRAGAASTTPPPVATTNGDLGGG